MSGIVNGGAPRLSAFGSIDAKIQRGTGIDLTNGIQTGFSESTQYEARGSGSAADLEQATLDETGKKGKDANKTMGVDTEAADVATKFYEEGLIYLATICDLVGYIGYQFGANVPNSFVNSSSDSNFSWISTSEDQKS